VGTLSGCLNKAQAVFHEKCGASVCGSRLHEGSMDTKKVIADLREQLQMVNQIIRIVEHLAASHERRRGRPPKRLKQTRAQNTA
jgi:hypothetical protein